MHHVGFVCQQFEQSNFVGGRQLRSELHEIVVNLNRHPTRRPAHFNGVVYYNDAGRIVGVDGVVPDEVSFASCSFPSKESRLASMSNNLSLVDAVRFSTDTPSTGQERSS